jgi:beta-lactamase regulating signal transducer with metallopeptidase domain/peroxiredoxin
MFPTGVLSWSTEFSEAVLRLGVNVLFQSTLLIALGLIVGQILCRKGAAVQSVVYRLTLAAVLACPLVSFLWAEAGMPGPSMNWHILATPATVSSADISAAVEGIADRQPMFPVPKVAQPVGSLSSERRTASFAWDAKDARVPAAMRWLEWRPMMVGTLAAVWLLGAGLLVIRLLLGWRLAISLRRTASPVDSQTIKDCRALAKQIGVPVPRVLRSPFSTSPLLLGVLRPVIILPEEEAGVSSREILVHELAHLARGDVFWRLLGHIGTTLLFFQPLAWILARWMVIAAEEVCDDCVLHLGFPRRNYAQRLADVAERYQTLQAVGVGMISLRSWVGRRVKRILDSSRPLSLRAGRRTTGLATAISLAATILIGSVGIGGKPSDAAPVEPATGTERSQSSDTPLSGPSDRSSPAKRSEGKPSSQDRKFQNGMGWIWHLKPHPANWYMLASRGLVLRLDELKHDQLLLTLARSTESTREAVDFRPVAFNASGQRFEFTTACGGGAEGVNMNGFVLDLKRLPRNQIKFIGIEKLTKDNLRDVVAPAAFQKLKGAHVNALPFPRLGEHYDFELTTIDGKKIASTDLHGKVVLLDFWATWCSPCMTKMPRLKQTYQKLNRRGFEIVGLNHDQTLEEAKRTIAKQELPWPNVLAPTGQLELWFAATGTGPLPRLLLLDRNGILRADISPDSLDAEIEKLVNKP